MSDEIVELLLDFAPQFGKRVGCWLWIRVRWMWGRCIFRGMWHRSCGIWTARRVGRQAWRRVSRPMPRYSQNWMSLLEFDRSRLTMNVEPLSNPAGRRCSATKSIVLNSWPILSNNIPPLPQKSKMPPPISGIDLNSLFPLGGTCSFFEWVELIYGLVLFWWDIIFE